MMFLASMFRVCIHDHLLPTTGYARVGVITTGSSSRKQPRQAVRTNGLTPSMPHGAAHVSTAVTQSTNRLNTLAMMKSASCIGSTGAGVGSVIEVPLLVPVRVRASLQPQIARETATAKMTTAQRISMMIE